MEAANQKGDTMRFLGPRMVFPAALLVCSTLGCSSEPPELVEVHEMVTSGGRPLAGVALVFLPIDKNGTVARGVTGDDGQYTLTHESEKAGAEPGEYKVIFRVFGAPPRPKRGGADPPSFSNPSTTPHRATVTADGAKLDFELGRNNEG
jgi:hypothetical protein